MPEEEVPILVSPIFAKRLAKLAKLADKHTALVRVSKSATLNPHDDPNGNNNATGNYDPNERDNHWVGHAITFDLLTHWNESEDRTWDSVPSYTSDLQLCGSECLSPTRQSGQTASQDPGNRAAMVRRRRSFLSLKCSSSCSCC